MLLTNENNMLLNTANGIKPKNQSNWSSRKLAPIKGAEDHFSTAPHSLQKVTGPHSTDPQLQTQPDSTAQHSTLTPPSPPPPRCAGHIFYFPYHSTSHIKSNLGKHLSIINLTNHLQSHLDTLSVSQTSFSLLPQDFTKHSCQSPRDIWACSLFLV